MKGEGRSRPVGIGIVMIAIAVQALTPDLADLCSSRIFRIIAASQERRPRAPGQRVRCPAPVPRDGDSLAGESCTVARSETTPRISHLRRVTMSTSFLSAPPESCHLGRSSTPYLLTSQTGRLLPSLGRLRC